MDRGPVRTRSGGGMINSRPDSSSSQTPYRQPEEPEPVVRDEAPVHHVQPRHTSIKEAVQPPKKRRLVLPIAGAVIIIALIFVGFFVVKGLQGNGPTGINSNEYQAVFFTNGQVYFGKLQAFNKDSMKMTDIFYLQTQSTDSSNPQKTSTDSSSSNVQLVKLGNEIHGPEDAMILSKDQVLFYENLKSDSKVVQSIQKYKDSNK